MFKTRTQRIEFLKADLLIVAIVCLWGVGFIKFVGTARGAFHIKSEIDTSLIALPEYALLSCVRSFLALILSYIFAVFYGTLAASRKSFERVLIPLLDVLQSLPVIAFLPGLVLFLITLFQDSQIGLELACLLTIFTGQVWNLIFAYYESQKSIPPEFRHVAKIYGLNRVQRFFLVDFPNGYRPLIYNGMMSMAGGWFFLTTCEAFTLGNQDFKLPGLGSYIAETFATQNYTNFCYALLTLLLIVVGTDFLLWKPLIAWVQRFKDRDDDEYLGENNTLLNILKHTYIPRLISGSFKRTIHFFLPQYHILAPGATRNIFLRSFNKISTIKISLIVIKILTRFYTTLKLPWIITFCVGGLVFSGLPYLPLIGESLATISSDDWLSLMHSMLITAAKVFCILIVSTLWAVPFGLWIGLKPSREKWVQPIIQNLAAFPAPVLFPLIVMSLAHLQISPEVTSTLLMAIASQWYVLFNVIGGAASIPSELKLVSSIYHLNYFQKLRKLYIPALLPSLTLGWVSVAGGAWNACMVAELVSFPGGELKSNGIGAQLAIASAAGNYPKLIAAIMCIVVFLVILNGTLWRTLQTYSEESTRD
jgi:NitT/TauT family transport system permease protein